MRQPSKRKQRERHSGPPCPHYPHKFKTEAAHQARNAARARNHKRMMESSLNYRLRAILRTIVQRCNDPRHTSYKWYGQRGIRNYLTLTQLRVMWKRDNAAAMRKPSIDRSHRDDNYVFSKCKFVELSDNVRRGVETREANKKSKHGLSLHLQPQLNNPPHTAPIYLQPSFFDDIPANPQRLDHDAQNDLHVQGNQLVNG